MFEPRRSGSAIETERSNWTAWMTRRLRELDGAYGEERRCPERKSMRHLARRDRCHRSLRGIAGCLRRWWRRRIIDATAASRSFAVPRVGAFAVRCGMRWDARDRTPLQ